MARRLSQQVCLRLSDMQRAAIREKLEEMRRGLPDPLTVTEADAHRALLDEAARIKKADAEATV